MSSFNTLLFDLDGTLTDPHEGITGSIRYAMTQMQRPLSPDADLGWCIGPPLPDSFHHLLQTDDTAAVTQAIGFYRERFATAGLYENVLYPSIPEALATLQAAGKRLFVATSKPTVYAQKIVDHFGLSVYFEKVYGSELNGRLGQKSDLIAHILRQEGLAAVATMMIGDRRHDIKGALANGVQAIGVTYGYGTPQELQQAGAHRLIGQPADLTRLAV